MKIRLLILLAILCVFSASAASAQDEIRVTVNPKAVAIGTLYNGTTATATGSIPADSEAVVSFLGIPSKVHMKQTAKVGGVVWMNTASVNFEKAPSVCIVSSAVALKKLAGASGAVDDLSLAGLKKTIVIDAKECKGLDVFDEFLKMKKKEGLYREVSGNISYGKTANGLKTFTAVIPLPSRLSPGVYTIATAAVRNGQIVARGQQTLEAKLEGAPALMASLAFNHSILYGFLATLIAVLAGLGIGLVFQSKGAH